ncbi:MAG: triose-phosphate isomerase [Candidatus Poribacteria bacterium]|nr:triose-phosphate isomerase [Candidatus Poribacteria bacterium]MDE0506929.1 triose-phosphate isomerase [Candidatus Poribacteria bacterium]
MRTPIVVANWKLNKTVGEAVEFTSALKGMVSGVDGVEVVVTPAFTALNAVASTLSGSNIHLSAQDVFWADNGAFTGEISPAMLKDVGCEYVIIGHSERRQYFGETNESVNKKVKAALSYDLRPIVCVGESLEDREAGRTESVIDNHVRNGIAGISPEAMQSAVIAYEPVWAIGTGVTATPDQAQDAHLVIRSLLSELYSVELAAQVRIQYGGSVKPENTSELMTQPDVDGALVGGASLEVESFAAIARLAG